MQADVADSEHVLAAYKLLAASIRNRDAHAYVPKVRDSHHDLISQLFARAFDLLIGWVPRGTAVVQQWRTDSASFVANL